MEKTTIQISKNTLARLQALKQYERQSYEETLNNLIDEAEEEELSDEEIKDIQVALENVKRGKVKPIEQVAKEIGVSLE
jgi:predicted CopG family antitoxin